MQTTVFVRCALIAALMIFTQQAFNQSLDNRASRQPGAHHETPDQPYVVSPPGIHNPRTAAGPVTPGLFTKQVNVDANGNNIPMDAANEPSIAVDPKNPNRMVIGWRQFNSVTSNFRQAGWAYTSDGGQHWTFPGVIEPGIFRSDPVLDADASGNFYYNSLHSEGTLFTCKVFKSTDGGATWDAGTDAYGGDKQWMVIDHAGSGHFYSFWTYSYSSCEPGFFTRSTDGGISYENCVPVAMYPFWGILTVGPDRAVYVAGNPGTDGIGVVRSTSASIPGAVVDWEIGTLADVDGYIMSQGPQNPVGLLGQAYVAVDSSNGPGHGNVYVLAAVHRVSNNDPGDIMFARSTDGWLSWDPRVRINNDNSITNIQWFGTMSVAPNGRIDVVWLDTRDAPPGTYKSALYYCYSDTQGETWSINKKISETFDPSIGYPQQDKMGDYFDMVSDNNGAHLAWTNTLNGEEDVYYTFITPEIVGVEDRPARPPVSLACNPNPVRDYSRISYTIPEKSVVRLEIIDLSGRIVSTLADQEQEQGHYSIPLDGSAFTPGYYLCRLTAGKQVRTARMVVTR